MQVEVSFHLHSIKLDIDGREMHVFGKVKVGKREIPLHKMRKMLEGEWKNLEEIGVRALTEAVNEVEQKGK